MTNVLTARRSTAKSLLLLIIGVAMAASLAWVPKASHACSCRPPGLPSESLQDASAVFAGKVLSVEPGGLIPPSDAGGEFTPTRKDVRIQVSRSWKGGASGTVTITTAEQSASCGYSFETGREYLVYADRTEDGDLAVSLCSRTALLENAQADVTALGQGAPAPSPTPTPNPSPNPAPTPQPPAGGAPPDEPVAAEPKASVPMNVAIGLAVIAALAIGYAIGTRGRKP